VVLKLDRSGSSTEWVKHFGDDGADTATAIADSSGTTIVVGSVEGNVDFGGGLTASSGEGDAFVLALDASGAYAWATRLAGTGDDHAYGVAVDSGGNIFVVGSFTESMSVGTTTLSTVADADAFVVKLDAGGRPLWAKQLGVTQLALALGVAVDAQGAVVVVGGYRGSIDAGGGALASAFVRRQARRGRQSPLQQELRRRAERRGGCGRNGRARSHDFHRLHRLG
jgi:hypothetical protein